MNLLGVMYLLARDKSGNAEDAMVLLFAVHTCNWGSFKESAAKQFASSGEQLRLSADALAIPSENAKKAKKAARAFAIP
jgi:hypothetical protein